MSYSNLYILNRILAIFTHQIPTHNVSNRNEKRTLHFYNVMPLDRYEYNIIDYSHYSPSMMCLINIKYNLYHQTCVFHLSTHFFLYCWNCWGHSMSRAVQEGCIASCVWYFLLPDRTHTWGLLWSTPISVSVHCCMCIL